MRIRRNHQSVTLEDGNKITCPGEHLAKELRKQHLSQRELAVCMGHSEKFISQLITGKVRLTYDVALELERVLEVPASKWNTLEAKFQEALTRRQQLDALDSPETARWVASFPYARMAEKGLVEQSDDIRHQAASLLGYFRVANMPAYLQCLDSPFASEHFKALMQQVDSLR